MRVPKRFKVHEATDESVTLLDGWIVALDHASVAYVPLLEAGQRLGADFPRREAGEDRRGHHVAARSFQEATRGSKGEGLIRVVEDGTEACAGDGKPWVRHEFPTVVATPDLERILHDAYAPPAEGRQEIEVILDAEALLRVSRAIGAGEDGVRLKFHAVRETGRCDAERGFIEVRPAREPAGGGFGILMAVSL